MTDIGEAKTKLRFPTRYACPVCNRKMLNYSDHPHAFGWKDYGHVYCRGCRTVFRAVQLSGWIAHTEEVLDKDGRWPAEYLIKKDKDGDDGKSNE